MAKAKKKTARQLDADIAKATLLPADWPDAGRRVVEKAAREYDRAIDEDWAVPDIEMDAAIKEVYANLERIDNAFDAHYQHTAEFDRDGTWYSRYESGRLDSEIRAAIQAWGKLTQQRSPRM